MHIFSRRHAHFPTLTVVRGKLQGSGDKLLVIFGDEAGTSRQDKIFRSAIARDDGRNAGSGRLLNDVAVGIAARGEQKKVQASVGLRELRVAEYAGKNPVCQMAFEPGAFTAFADDQK